MFFLIVEFLIFFFLNFFPKTILYLGLQVIKNIHQFLLEKIISVQEIDNFNQYENQEIPVHFNYN